VRKAPAKDDSIARRDRKRISSTCCRKEVSMNSDALLNIEELEIEPITDEILVSVLGGLGEEDGFWPSCSYTMCSSKPIDE
jgi:hypothetical protein